VFFIASSTIAYSVSNALPVTVRRVPKRFHRVTFSVDLIDPREYRVSIDRPRDTEFRFLFMFQQHAFELFGPERFSGTIDKTKRKTKIVDHISSKSNEYSNVRYDDFSIHMTNDFGII